MPDLSASHDPRQCVIIGAGPAGLTAAYELCQKGHPAIVLEADEIVGGISRTVEYKGYRFDIGGHRFFTKVELVQEWWKRILPDDFLIRPRLSRIYYADKFFDYPLKPLNALMGLGLVESVRIGLSYLWVQLFPHRREDNFEQWVSNRFGTRLYEIFFKTYTEKVWGIACTEIGADWAAQRIKNLDLLTAVRTAFLGNRSNAAVVTTLVEQFHYPRLGPGMMWERVTELLDKQGYPVLFGSRVIRVAHANGRVESVTIRSDDGEVREIPGAQFVSSMPIKDLFNALDPPPPPPVLQAANDLGYRDFLTVGLVLDCADPFPDNWIYIHSAKVAVGRIQNFKAWSPEMVPDETKSCIGLEYFVQENDELWSMNDDDLIALGTRECAALGLIDARDVVDGVVIRMPKAYPVYDLEYEERLATIRAYLDGLPNLQLIGRNGQHRYNNQDHSMVTAIFAAHNIASPHETALDVWDVNVEDEYHEELRGEAEAERTARGGDRLVPQRLDLDRAERLMREAFARYDAFALGCAVAIPAGLLLFSATALLLLKGGSRVGMHLTLLGNYLLGFQVSWPGAIVGGIEAAAVGFGFGWAVAKLINATVGWHERLLLRRLERRSLLARIDEEVG